MAFTDAQKETLVSILGGVATTTLLTAHLTRLGATLTTAKQTYIEGQMTRWEDASVVYESVEPTESNFGVRVGPTAEKQDIRGNIARSLEWPYPISSASMGSLQIG